MNDQKLGSASRGEDIGHRAKRRSDMGGVEAQVGEIPVRGAVLNLPVDAQYGTASGLESPDDRPFVLFGVHSVQHSISLARAGGRHQRCWSNVQMPRSGTPADRGGDAVQRVDV